MPPIQFANSGYVRAIITGEIKVSIYSKSNGLNKACKNKGCLVISVPYIKPWISNQY